MKDEHLFKKEAKDLEEKFFAKQNERLLRELREKAKVEEKRKALQAVVKVKDPTIIEHLLELGVGPSLFWLLRSFPWLPSPGPMEVWTIRSEKPSSMRFRAGC